MWLSTKHKFPDRVMMYYAGFLLVYFLVSISCSSSATANNSLQRRNIEEFKRRSVRGREMLMDNLKRFHNHEPPIVLINPITQAYDFEIPEDAVAEIASYLSLKDLKSFGLASHFTNQIKSKTINLHLFNFSKYYVFAEQWLNDLIFSIINSYFQGADANLKSSKIFDFIERITFYGIKYPNNLRNQLPSNIYRSILTFFHETIYGLGAFVPTNLTDWEYNFALKLDKYKQFPSTRGYYVGAISRRTQYDDSREERMHHLFNFLVQNTTYAEKQAYIQRVLGFYGGEGSEFALFLRTDWSVPDSLSETEALQFMDTLATFRICSNEIWSKLELITRLSPQVRDSAAQRMFDYAQLKHYKAFFKDSDFKVTDTLSYLRSRNLNNPFCIEEIQQFDDFDPSRILYDLQSVQIPFLVKLDAISKLIRTFSINFRHRLPDYSSDGISIYELLLLEHTVSEFSQNNPLALLLHHYLYLPNRPPNIFCKYNLNISYKFDISISCSKTGILGDIARFLEGKTLTFRQILYILRDTRSYKSFSDGLGLYKPEHFEESEDDIEFYPIYSVKEYLKAPNLII